MFGFALDNPVVRGVAFALLGFLLANALWQHTSLRRACVGAVAVTIMMGTILSFFQQVPSNVPTSSFLGAFGGLIGAVLAYPILKVVDRHTPSIS